MKTRKILVISAMIISTMVVVSCKKDKNESDLTNQVTGTYNGTLTQGALKSGAGSAKCDVSRFNDYTVEIHCYGIELDTTFMLELYQNANYMMACFTSDDFYNEYGHYESEDHHMMGNNGDWTNWDQHMSNDHESGDQHYGSFNTDDHTFDYTLKMHNNQGDYTLRFIGSKE
jgi:hypothetical protein